MVPRTLVLDEWPRNLTFSSGDFYSGVDEPIAREPKKKRIYVLSDFLVAKTLIDLRI